MLATLYYRPRLSLGPVLSPAASPSTEFFGFTIDWLASYICILGILSILLGILVADGPILSAFAILLDKFSPVLDSQVLKT